MIKAEDIYLATEGGKAVILHYYPQAAAGFSGKRNFKLRPDDKNPSCTVFLSSDGHWLLQDKGGSDTKAYNAVSLVMREEGLDYPMAIEWIAAKFAPELLEDKDRAQALEPKPDMTEVAPVDSIAVEIRPSGTFTPDELAILGYKITPDICEALCLKPLDAYVTAKNAAGKSFRIAGNATYPMYYYDYGLYGKIYCPLGGKFRFQWKDKSRIEKEDAELKEQAIREGKAVPPPRIIPLSGEKEFMERYTAALAGEWVPETTMENEYGEEDTVDMKWDKLIICSGPSDALNVKNAGYHVCWPNSETADFTEDQFRILSDIAKKIYILYDIDETGIRNMYKIALQYLDISIIRLPEDLKKKRARGGKPCKDAKDFFMYFRKPESQNPVRLFDELVKLSGGLKFWTAVQQKNGAYKYDINNDQMYSFLEASGFYTIDTTTNKEGFTFCRIEDNKVTLIDKEAIAAECSMYLLEYLRTHPKYYSQTLVNAIHRSKQITAANLNKLRRIHPDFNAYTEDHDYLWFRNGIVRVGTDGVMALQTKDVPYMVYSSKIIDHDFTRENPYFEIGYTPEYGALLDRLHAATPSTPEYYDLSRQIDTIDDVKRYTLEIRKWGSTFMQYVYNTGRAHWRKEETGGVLTDDEKRETDLNFISKCLALGYLLSKHKNSGQPYAVYAMEMEQGDEGEHLGGTGKSMYLNAVEKLRCQHYVDAQRMKEDKMQFFLQGVVRGVTDTVFMDDLNNSINLHLFMNMVTGKMVVDVKHANPFTLEFLESPKLGFTSNHAIKNFDDSLNRRIWFAAFSDYYHSDSQKRKLKLRSPRTEFGKDLIDQYTPEEMNHFYNFMLNCVMMWHKIHERVQPPMKSILQRTLIKSMTEDFFYWAEDWFIDTRLNCYVDQKEALDAYMETLSKRSQDFVSWKKFKDKLKEFCQYQGWTFNPDEVFTSPSDRKADRIHRKVDGQDRYYFYIDTGDQVKEDGVNVPGEAPPLGDAGNPDGNDSGDEPPF